MDEKEIIKNVLILLIIVSGSVKYFSVRVIFNKLDDLYGLFMGVDVVKCGEC